jgi:hypothetical protein
MADARRTHDRLIFPWASLTLLEDTKKQNEACASMSAFSYVRSFCVRTSSRRLGCFVCVSLVVRASKFELLIERIFVCVRAP